MRAFGTFLLIVVCALVLGAGSALYYAERAGAIADIEAGPWQANSLAGSADADIYERAVIARVAMLALTREEATYYIASEDSAGRPLVSDCRYSVSGDDMPARWWSITIYGEDLFLIPHDAPVYSYTKTDMLADGGAPFAFELARDGSFIHETANRVLVNGTSPGTAFSMLMRLYQPQEDALAAPSDIPAPQITRLGCD